jgi:hypothetical protein
LGGCWLEYVGRCSALIREEVFALLCSRRAPHNVSKRCMHPGYQRPPLLFCVYYIMCVSGGAGVREKGADCYIFASIFLFVDSTAFVFVICIWTVRRARVIYSLVPCALNSRRWLTANLFFSFYEPFFTSVTWTRDKKQSARPAFGRYTIWKGRAQNRLKELVTYSSWLFKTLLNLYPFMTIKIVRV